MEGEAAIGLQFTGHPLVDVGVATIVAFAGRSRPEEVTEGDLEAIASYMAAQYVKSPLRGFLTVAFPNSGFTQPAFFRQRDKQQVYIDRVLFAFREDRPQLDERDVFMDLPVADVSFDVYDGLEAGRVFRQHVPLQTGVGTINFHPYGEAGLPISGLALFAIQAYPLGSAKCGGRTLFVHSDDPEIMVFFARRFLEENRLVIRAAQLKLSKKLPGQRLKFRTLVVATLVEALDRRRGIEADREVFSVSVYHLTNSGQGADLALYHLPVELVGFLAEMGSAAYRGGWQRLVEAAWIAFKPTRKHREAPPDFKPDRNWLYEDLFNLAADPYGNGRRFVRSYFLREAYKYARGDVGEPGEGDSGQDEALLVLWGLTACFLGRLMSMDSERIEGIRQLGDALAEYVREEDDRGFFRSFYGEKRYGYLRDSLIRANSAYVKSGHEPFLTLDGFIGVFEDGEELASRDWWLARDLVLIRMVERLYRNGWLVLNQDAIPEGEESVMT